MKVAKQKVPLVHNEIKLTHDEELYFWSKVDKTGGPDACWPWTLTKIKGYGAVRFDICWGIGRSFRSHRIAWVLTHGQIPYDNSYHGLCVCHNCPGGDNPACCNPKHLFLGTQGDNMRDKEAKGRANRKCLRGEKSFTAKLNTTQVIEIRSIYAAGEKTLCQIASQFGVSITAIFEITKFKSWRHVIDPTHPLHGVW